MKAITTNEIGYGAAKTAISGDYHNLYNLGQMCAEGFKQGIMSKNQEIADAAAALANAAFFMAGESMVERQQRSSNFPIEFSMQSQKISSLLMKLMPH